MLTYKSLSLAWLLFIASVTAEKTYPFASWMGDMKAAATTYGANLYSSTLYDIVLPGSHHSGQWTFQTSLSSDDLAVTLSNTGVFSTEEREPWSKRQNLDITNQLNAGARFLDLKFERDSSGEFYTHCGLLGDHSSTIFSDIASFIGTAGSEEIVIISLSQFIPSTDVDTDLPTLFAEIVTALGSYMAEVGTHDLTSMTLQDLIDAGVQIIAFSDEKPLVSTDNAYFFDSTDWLSGGESDLNSNATTAQLVVVDNMRYGWDRTTLYEIVWSLPISNLYTTHNTYDSYFDYEQTTLNYIRTTLLTYPKLRFGNVISVDFVDVSNIVELVILLNWNYLNCDDDFDATDVNATETCADWTSLSIDYKTSATSSLCVTTPGLNTTCSRSCGHCPYYTGIPGEECTSNADCSSAYYTANGLTTGVCYVTPSAFDSFITSASFCQSADMYLSCGVAAFSDDCASGGGSAVTIDTDTCDRCTKDYQCADGYCNYEYAACLNITSESFYSAQVVTWEVNAYDFITSSDAKEFRADIDGLRPGDPEDTYSFTLGSACNSLGGCLDLMEANPYIYSLIGFIIIPFILAIVLLTIYCFCLCPWCCCDRCAKRCCCKCCLGDPKESMFVKWGPCVCLGIALVFVVWGCSEGITGNADMHAHLFTNEDSFVNEVDDVFGTIIDKFDGVNDIAEWVLDNLDTIITYIDGILDSTGDMGTALGDLYGVFNNLTAVYGQPFALSVNVTDPISGLSTTSTVTCAFCDSIGSSLQSLNSSMGAASASTLSTLSNTLNATTLLVDAKSGIDSAVAEFDTAVGGLVTTVYKYQNKSRDMFDKVESYDEDRESGGFIFFCVPFIWLVFPVLGIMLRTKWCFKINWCLAMYLGGFIMFFFSFFAIVSVGWADFCVRLDDFERDLGDSQLGQIMGNTSNSTGRMFDVVNACFHGTSLTEMFNLDEYLIWDEYRDNLTDATQIDVVKYLENDDLSEFETDVALLDASDFQVSGDEALAALNGISNCSCPPQDTTYQVDTFTRVNVLSGNCTTNVSYWQTVVTANNPTCRTAFSAAYSQISAENQLAPQIDEYIAGLQTGVGSIYTAYDSVIAVAVVFENALANISCLIDPVFDEFDVIIFNYSNCGFIGQIYGEFKRIGCVDLFGDMYSISKGMMILAFTSILVVLFSQCMDYVQEPGEKQNALEKKWSEMELPGMNDAGSPRPGPPEDPQPGAHEVGTNYVTDENEGGGTR